jgi:hypothetical protein
MLCGCVFASKEGVATSSKELGTSSPAMAAASSSGPAVLVQHVSGSNLRSNSLASPYCYSLQLPAPTTAGNAVVVGATWRGTATLTVTDDRNDAYAISESFFDSADNQSIAVATSFRVAAGARNLAVCFNADPGGWVQPMVTEFSGVVGTDGAGSGGSGIGSTATATSLTPGGTDLLYQVAYAPSTSGIASSVTAGSGDYLLSADLRDGWSAQYGLAAAGAPSLSLGTSLHWTTAAVLLEQGVAGSVPGGMRILRAEHLNLPVSTGAGGTGSPFPNPIHLEVPSSGNLLVTLLGSGNGSTASPQVTGITDGNGNAWVNAKTVQSGDAVSQIYYAGNALTGSSLPVSMAWSLTVGTDATAIFYDIAGASQSPFDLAVGAGGSADSLGANLTLPFTVTPSRAGELVFVSTPWDFDTAGGLMGGLDDTETTSGESESGPWPVDENNGWGHAVSTSTSPIQFAWVPLFHEIEFGSYAATAAAFKPGGAAAAPAVSVWSLSALTLLLALAGAVL